MLTGKIDTRELDRALRRISNNASPAKTGAALQKGGQPIRDRARQLVHVITGKLKGSIFVSNWFRDGGGVSVIVGTDVDYAAMEEFGGLSGKDRFGNPLPPHLRNRQPHPYMRPAYEQTRNEALRIVRSQLERGIL